MSSRKPLRYFVDFDPEEVLDRSYRAEISNTLNGSGSEIRVYDHQQSLEEPITSADFEERDDKDILEALKKYEDESMNTTSYNSSNGELIIWNRDEPDAWISSESALDLIDYR